MNEKNIPADAVTEPAAASYGETLHDKIRELASAGTELSEFDKFILDRGFYFDSEDALKSAFFRRWKCSHGDLLAEAEFIAEAQVGCPNNYDVETLSAVYKVLVDMAKKNIIKPAEIYRYAYYSWCLRNPDAIIAYQIAPSGWSVNNCATEISDAEARLAACEEWGFEASRVRIIGQAYYDATDWQFIRFDCAHMAWLWQNGNLYQVYN